MKEYQTYIFDLDGTLLSTLADLAASTNHALRLNGMPEHSLDDVPVCGQRREGAHGAGCARRGCQP